MQANAGARDYLTTSEVADYLRLKERTVYELVARRQIPCARVTGKLIFPKRLVDRWVEANTEFQDQRLLMPPPIVAGSSDPLLEWALRESGSGLATLFEGSEAGLERFAAGQAIAVGLHLADPDGQGYNAAASERLRLTDLVLIQWAWREQGLIVGRGNPLGIHELADLVRKKPRLVLRQQGAGAQRLLEQLLNEAGLSLSDINAVPAVALTESDVAGMVADGQADCGLAVGTVAHRFGLGFVPLRRERFDIACCRRSYFEPPLQRLFGFARLAAFRARAEALRHYDVTCAGQVEFSA